MSAGVARRQGRQARKTRAALLQAFRELIVRKRYADIRVGDLIRQADVGRSTFYEHFRDKNDLFRASLTRVLSVLADAVEDDCDLFRLEGIIEHFRANAALARNLCNGVCAVQLATVLGDLLAERLTRLAMRGRQPLPWLAAEIAGAQLGLLRTWINEGATGPASAIALALRRGSIALRDAG